MKGDRLKILFSQSIPDQISHWRVNWKKGQTSPGNKYQFLENIDHFLVPAGTPKKALISLLPSDWTTGLSQYPDIRIFNTIGLTFLMVKMLNEKGYIVDVHDYRYENFIPFKDYDFYFAHSGYCRTILDNLPAKTFVLHYASGAYWKEFNRMSQERYDLFCARKNLKPITTFIRSLEGITEGEDYLARKADATFLSGPRTVDTFRCISKDLRLLYLGAYLDKSLIIRNRNFEKGRKNFIYVAGTGGNIQKGMDLLIEAFAGMPHLNLYIYCKIEKEIETVYKKELKLNNIHYVYHYRLKPFRKRLISLLSNSAFTISAPIDTGPGTAMIGSIGLGLIPVGYIDIEANEADNCLTDRYTIPDLKEIIEKASCKSVEWLTKASELNFQKYADKHDPESFIRNFSRMFDTFNIPKKTELN